MIKPAPNQIPLISDTQSLTHTAWLEFFSEAYAGIAITQQSGTTANRPTRGLFIGRPYFDVSLGANGKPIWVNKLGTGWVDATGVVV
jgi:hypothetical protein